MFNSLGERDVMTGRRNIGVNVSVAKGLCLRPLGLQPRRFQTKTGSEVFSNFSGLEAPKRQRMRAKDIRFLNQNVTLYVI